MKDPEERVGLLERRLFERFTSPREEFESSSD
jgi:hypothetical protein